MKKISKKSNNSRCKQVSVIIQPKINGDYWLSKNLTDELIEKKLMESSYPLYTEIKQSLATCLGLTCSSKVLRPPKYFVFGTETSVTTNIPHYQCCLIYPALIRRTSVYEFL